MPFGDGSQLGFSGINALPLKRCPHCHVANPAILIKTSVQVVPGALVLPAGAASLHWFIWSCETCGGIVAGAACKTLNGQFLHGAVSKIEWLIPAPRSIDSALPVKVSHFLKEAQQTLTSPSASIVMSNSAIDAILKDKGFKAGSLHSRIESATAAGVITKDMAAVAHDVRLDANNERHADDDAPLPTIEDAQRCFDFAEGLAEMIFVLPQRVKQRAKP